MSRSRKKSTAPRKRRPAPGAGTGAGDPAGGAPSPSTDHVAQLAFQFFVESGFVHGQALDHWLRAEAELRRQGPVDQPEPS